jgi:hypothetical protein
MRGRGGGLEVKTFHRGGTEVAEGRRALVGKRDFWGFRSVRERNVPAP